MAQLLSQSSFRLREFFAAPPSSDAVEEAGPWGSVVAKGSHTAIGGDMYWSSNGDGQLALRVSASGNGGSDKDFAFTNAKAESGVRAVPKACRWYFFFNMDDDLMSLANQNDASGAAGADAAMRYMELTQRNFYRSYSVYSWYDGRGGCASLSATSLVGTTITLANKNMVRAFEVDDVIVAFDPAVYFATQPGVVSVTRGPLSVLTVTGRDEDLGTLTLSAAFSSIGGVAGDVIGHRANIPLAGTGLTATLYGVGTYVAMRTADRTISALGVTRSTDPGRIAGRFATMAAGTPTVEVLNKMGSLAGRFKIKISSIFCESDEYEDLARQYNNKRRYATDVTKLQFGADGFEAVFPYSTAGVMCDPYLWSIDSSDRIFVGLIEDNWRYVTTKDGVGWRLRGRAGENGLHDTDGKGNLSAQYGAVGQLVTDKPHQAIVIRVPR